MSRSRPSRSKRLLAIAIAVPALAACDAIIGLSDYTKVECNGGGACLDDSGIDATVSSDGGSPDGGGNGEGGRGAEPVSWALWPMPNYPGAEGGKAPVLTLNATTVTDTITNLVWQLNPTGTPLNFQAAHDACAALTLEGGTWRLPKRIELVTLLDYSHGGQPYINTDPAAFGTGFPQTVAWTSSEVRTVDDSNVVTVTGSYWTVSFSEGTVKPAAATATIAMAFCVKNR